jgi:hypothetical protein
MSTLQNLGELRGLIADGLFPRPWTVKQTADTAPIVALYQEPLTSYQAKLLRQASSKLYVLNKARTLITVQLVKEYVSPLGFSSQREEVVFYLFPLSDAS